MEIQVEIQMEKKITTQKYYKSKSKSKKITRKEKNKYEKLKII